MYMYMWYVEVHSFSAQMYDYIFPFLTCKNSHTGTRMRHAKVRQGRLKTKVSFQCTYISTRLAVLCRLTVGGDDISFWAVGGAAPDVAVSWVPLLSVRKIMHTQ